MTKEEAKGGIDQGYSSPVSNTAIRVDDIK
jgi:hypothetical protein